jgi:hypothetical protein
MGFFTKNKQITSNEYADLLGKITLLTNDITILKAKCAELETANASIRGTINRKLGKMQSDESGMDDADQRALKDFIMQMGYRPPGA